MTMLDDRLHRTADDLHRAAAAIPPRPAEPRPRVTRRAPVWIGVAAVVAALVALPLWLGPFGGEGEAPPVGGAGLEEQAHPGAWVDGIAVIGFLADGLGAADLEALLAEVAAWDEVERVEYFSREAAVAEFLELFAGQEAVVRVVEDDPSIIPASIRLALVAGADRYEVGLRLEALPAVFRVAVSDDDPGPADGADPPPVVGETTVPTGEPFPGDVFAAITGERPIPGTVRLVASREQDGFGTLSLFSYQVEPHPGFADDGTWLCLTAVAHTGTERAGAGAGSQCAPLGSDAVDEFLERGMLSGGSCLPARAGMLAVYGLDPAAGPAEVVLSDGRSITVDLVDGTLLLAWHGTDALPGIADIRLGASSESARWLREYLAWPGLDSPDWCFEDPDLPG